MTFAPGQSDSLAARMAALGPSGWLSFGGLALGGAGLGLSLAHFGGVTPLGQAYLWFLLAPGAVLLLAGRWLAGALPPPRIVEWLAFALAAYVWVQVLPMPAGLANTLSPETAVWSEILDRPARTISVYAPATLESAFFGAVLFLVFYAGRALGRWEEGRWKLVWFVAIFASLNCLYGLAQNYVLPAPPTIWGHPRAAAFANCVTGTFVNRNHFAALLVLAAPMAVALLWRVSPARRIPLGPGALSYDDELAARAESAGTLMELGRLAAWPVWGLLVLLFACVLLSRSRMGTAAFTLAALAALAQTPWFHGLVPRQRIVLATFAALVVFLFALMLGGGLGPRFKQLAVGGEPGRQAIWTQTIDMWSRSPAFGLGVGTFAQVFQRYDLLDAEEYAYHAHSDTLEHLSEAGLIGVGLMLAFLGALAGRFARFASEAGPAAGDSWAIGSACVASLAGLFCCQAVDFPLQFRGLLALTAVLAGALAGTSLDRPDPEAEAAAWDDNDSRDDEPDE